MQLVQKITTVDAFDSRGVFVPAGHSGAWYDETLDESKDEHLLDPGSLPPTVPIEIAAIAPTGPNPKIPQQIPADAVQSAGGDYVVPGKRLVSEVTDPAGERIDDRGLRDPDAEAQVTDALADVMDTSADASLNNNDDALVGGTVAEITADLGTKTDAELSALRAAEVDREKPRKGVLSAIDDELENRKATA